MNNITNGKPTRRRGCRRNNRQRGGAGMAYTLGGPVAGAPIINNYGQEIKSFPSCEEATRPGYLADAQIKGGLPGFGGGGKGKGKRKGKGKGKNSRRRRYYGGQGAPYPATYSSETTTAVTRANGTTLIPQPVPGATNVTTAIRGGRGGVLETGSAQLSAQMGGRYSNEFTPLPGGIGAIMEPRYSGCGDGALALPDALNKVQAVSLITAPPAQVPLPKPMFGGVGGVDSMVYEAPRSGYTTWPSNAQGGNAGTLSDGRTPFELRVPYTAMPNVSSACLKTGGGGARSKSKKNRSRKSRKSRRSRKSRSKSIFKYFF